MTLAWERLLEETVLTSTQGFEVTCVTQLNMHPHFAKLLAQNMGHGKLQTDFKGLMSPCGLMKYDDIVSGI